MRRWFVLLALGAAVVGCASTSENLQRETARNIGDVDPDKVTVSNVNRGVTSVRWDAETPKGPYSCSADDMVRRVHCVKK
jgi:tRNA A37 threonylcarbamoyladenosine dehydratase